MNQNLLLVNTSAEVILRSYWIEYDQLSLEDQNLVIDRLYRFHIMRKKKSQQECKRCQ